MKSFASLAISWDLLYGFFTLQQVWAELTIKNIRKKKTEDENDVDQFSGVIKINQIVTVKRNKNKPLRTTNGLIIALYNLNLSKFLHPLPLIRHRKRTIKNLLEKISDGNLFSSSKPNSGTTWVSTHVHKGDHKSFFDSHGTKLECAKTVANSNIFR